MTDAEHPSLEAEIDALRAQFPKTQDLYREVCVLLFFRHGIAPTANKLHQLVRKGSMSAPAEALSRFWADLRKKSRVRLDHPNLPEDLKTAAGELIDVLWTKAQTQADAELAALRAQAQDEIVSIKSGKNQAEAERDGARQQLEETTAVLSKAEAHIRELEQTIAGEVATRSALEQQLVDARQAGAEQLAAMAAARRDFASELDKLREALKVTEERYRSAEARALMEIDRERTVAAKLQKDIEGVRTGVADAADRHKTEVLSLQEQIGNQKQRIGHLEGELRAILASRDQLHAELAQERETLRDVSARLSSAIHEAEGWQQKTIDAHQELETLRSARQRRTRKDSAQLGLSRLTPE